MIELRGLRKRYDATTQALDHLDLTIEPGSLFGYIGPNGAGKSTTIKILATLEYPDRGEARVCGIDVVERPEEARRLIGYMPELFGLYDQLPVAEYLEFFARVYEVPFDRIDAVIELAGLEPKRDALCGTLSKGNRQRLYLARVLLHDPRVLLLDEPASGLDPLARIELRELLKELHRMGKTILISSHILADLEDICDTVGILEQGRLVVSGRLTDLRERMRSDFSITARADGGPDTLERLTAFLGSRDGVTGVSQGNGLVRFRMRGGPDDVNGLLRSALEVAPLYSFEADRGGLEDIFMRMTRGTVS